MCGRGLRMSGAVRGATPDISVRKDACRTPSHKWRCGRAFVAFKSGLSRMRRAHWWLGTRRGGPRGSATHVSLRRSPCMEFPCCTQSQAAFQFGAAASESVAVPRTHALLCWSASTRHGNRRYLKSRRARAQEMAARAGAVTFWVCLAPVA